VVGCSDSGNRRYFLGAGRNSRRDLPAPGLRLWRERGLPGDEVYVDGQPAATAQEYSQQAIALVNTPAVAATGNAERPPEYLGGSEGVLVHGHM
jgi:hypothetical protein